MDHKTAEREARKFARALEGPLGPRCMQAVVRDHVALFAAWRASGANWSQIATLLAATGVRGASGKLVSAANWRAMVSRAMRHLDVAEPGVSKVTRNQKKAPPDVDGPPPATEREPPVLSPTGMTMKRLADVKARIGRAASLRGIGRKDGAS